jgi:hypothetical protein
MLELLAKFWSKCLHAPYFHCLQLIQRYSFKYTNKKQRYTVFFITVDAVGGYATNGKVAGSIPDGVI